MARVFRRLTEQLVPKESWLFDDRIAHIIASATKTIIVRINKHTNTTLEGKPAWTTSTTRADKDARTIRLTFKDHANNIHEEEFNVDSLAPKRPKKGEEGLVLTGEHTGFIVTVIALLDKKMKYRVRKVKETNNKNAWIEIAENVTEIVDRHTL